MASASCKAQADLQIEQIRRNKGVTGHMNQIAELATDTDAALAILSNNLYQDSAHFLFELLQNADDNTFSEEVIPTLNILLYSRDGSSYLRTDCNERGFLLEDLQAICRIGQSTKTVAADGTRKSIGEKGIGFKSVFKVANVVNIASGHYEFKFDRDSILGMVLPIASPFPRCERVSHHTQFLLHLAKHSDYEKLNRDLGAIEPQSLLFLRKIRSLFIGREGRTHRHQIQQTTCDPALEGETAMLLSGDESGDLSETRKYIVVCDTVHGLSGDIRRQGITSSEVVLAFPISNSCAPSIGPQKVFAFLPIGDFGFKFLIHADFVLVASREGLEYDNAWNLELRNYIRNLFFKAIARIVRIPTRFGLRYMWPKYIRHHRSSHQFWNGLHKDIIRELSRHRVLESCDPAAGYFLPSDLRYLGSKYRFKGDAVFSTADLRKKHLSFGYDRCIAELRMIGICETSLSDLLRDLSGWLAENGQAALSTQPPEWHQQVASIFCNDAKLKAGLAKLPIIPVRDGSWVCANSGNLYLPSETEHEYVPSGIDINIIHEAASDNPVRRRFFQFLDIKTYTPRQVCSLILELHKGDALHAVGSREPEDLIKDAAYLFKHKSHALPQEASGIYFLVNNQGVLSHRKTQIYFLDDSADSRLVAKYQNSPENPFYILDARYETWICSKDDATQVAFHSWVLASGSVTRMPQLIRNEKLTIEWCFLRDRNALDLLLAVKHHVATGKLNRRLAPEVRQLHVYCRDGLQRPLQESAVPTRDLEQTCPRIAYIDVPEPEEWTFLSCFGVPIRPDTTANLRELVALANLRADQVDKDTVHSCYRRLNCSSDMEKHMIAEAFDSKALVFIVIPKPMWVSHNSCVWNAPSSLKHVIKLASRYSDCVTLFSAHLGVRSADIHHVVFELCSTSFSESPGDMILQCQDLLMTLVQYLPTGPDIDESILRRVRNAKVFPVMEARRDCQRHEPATYGLRAISDTDWYIPDRMTLGNAFRGKHNLLQFSALAIQRLQPLFERFCCCDKYLSTAVRETIELRGAPVHDTAREQELLMRQRYISALNTDAVASSSQDYKSVRVWNVRSIVVIRILDSVTIEEDDKLLTLQEDSNTINMYFRSVIPHLRQHTVTFELAKFFTELCNVKPDDINILNQLLNAPLQDLCGIFNEHNRFLPESEQSIGSIAVVDLTGEEQTHEDVFISRRSDGHDFSDQNSDLIQLFAGTEESAQTLTDQYSTHISLEENSPEQIRRLIPQFDEVTRSITRQSRRWRVGKNIGPRNTSGSRTRSRSPHVTPQRASRRDTLQLPGSPVAIDEGYSSAGACALSISQEISHREVGSYGELFMNTVLEIHIEDWSLENWTSKLRADHYRQPFMKPEKDYADFTYVDTAGRMKAFLQQNGSHTSPEWSEHTTYHLEVKTTKSGDHNEPFYLSQNQVNTMRKYDKDPNNAYILLRVFEIRGVNRNFKIYSCPWTLFLNGGLTLVSQGGYQGQASNINDTSVYVIRID